MRSKSAMADLTGVCEFVGAQDDPYNHLWMGVKVTKLTRSL